MRVVYQQQPLLKGRWKESGTFDKIPAFFRILIRRERTIAGGVLAVSTNQETNIAMSLAQASANAWNGHQDLAKPGKHMMTGATPARMCYGYHANTNEQGEVTTTDNDKLTKQTRISGQHKQNKQ